MLTFETVPSPANLGKHHIYILWCWAKKGYMYCCSFDILYIWRNVLHPRLSQSTTMLKPVLILRNSWYLFFLNWSHFSLPGAQPASFNIIFWTDMCKFQMMCLRQIEPVAYSSKKSLLCPNCRLNSDWWTYMYVVVDMWSIWGRYYFVFLLIKCPHTRPLCFILLIIGKGRVAEDVC